MIPFSIPLSQKNVMLSVNRQHSDTYGRAGLGRCQYEQYRRRMRSQLHWKTETRDGISKNRGHVYTHVPRSVASGLDHDGDNPCPDRVPIEISESHMDGL